MAVLTNEWLLLMLIGLCAGFPFFLYQEYKQEQKAIEKHGQNIDRHQQEIDSLIKYHNETINWIDSMGGVTFGEHFHKEMLRPNSYEQTKPHNNK